VARILVIENQSLLGKWIGLNLADAGHVVIQVRRPEEAHVQIETSRPDLVIFNTGLPAEVKGLFIRHWRELQPKTRVLDITDDADGAEAGPGGWSEADSYVRVPFMMERLIEVVEGLLDSDDGS